MLFCVGALYKDVTAAVNRCATQRQEQTNGYLYYSQPKVQSDVGSHVQVLYMGQCDTCPVPPATALSVGSSKSRKVTFLIVSWPSFFTATLLCCACAGPAQVRARKHIFHAGLERWKME
jgi:hypothetical protein